MPRSISAAEDLMAVAGSRVLTVQANITVEVHVPTCLDTRLVFFRPARECAPSLGIRPCSPPRVVGGWTANRSRNCQGLSHPCEAS